MMRKRRRSNRRTHGSPVFPKCLPSQDDLQAVYLGKIAPSSSGIVTDESGVSGDAMLVESPALLANGIAYAVGGTDSIHDSKKLQIKAIFKRTGASASSSIIVSKYQGIGNREFVLYIATNRLRVLLYDEEDNQYIIEIATISSDIWYSLDFKFDEGNIEFSLNGVITFTSITGVTIQQSTANLIVLNRADSSVPVAGVIALIEAGNAIFNCAEGGLCTKLINTGTGADADIINFIPANRDGLQDIFHYNNLNDIDIYTNGIAGEEIRIPAGKPFSQAGYTFVSTNPAGAWDNNGGAKLQLPATLKAVIDGDIPNPLSHEDWKTLYGTSPNYSALSNTKENEHKKLVFYDKFLSVDETLEALKCIKASEGEDILRDVNGDPLRDVNGILLIPSS